MSMKVSVYVGTSSDGFTARKDGALDWLEDANATVPEGEDCGYHAFVASVDVLIMGRKTFKQVLPLQSYGAEYAAAIWGNRSGIDEKKIR